MAQKSNGLCWYCGYDIRFKAPEIDHVHPVVSGGTNDIRNLVLSCSDCNRKKSDFSLDEYRAHIFFMNPDYSSEELKEFNTRYDEWPDLNKKQIRWLMVIFADTKPWEKLKFFGEFLRAEGRETP